MNKENVKKNHAVPADRWLGADSANACQKRWLKHVLV